MTNLYNDREILDFLFPNFLSVCNLPDTVNQHKVRIKNDTKFPPIDIYTEDKTKLVVEAVIAGFNKEEISVSIDDRHLIIKGEKQDQVTENRRYITKEISNRSFEQKILLPEDMLDLNKENIKVEYIDGKLTIVFNFTKEKIAKNFSLAIK